MEVRSNEQAFQSIYLHPDPEDWKGKIVFIDPTFETSPPAIMLFNTLRLENRPGLVVSGPKTSLMKLKNHVFSADARDSIGKSDDDEIIQYLKELVEQFGLTVEYIRDSRESQVESDAKKLGFERIGDSYLNKNKTRAFSFHNGQMIGLTTADFKVFKMNSLKDVMSKEVDANKTLNLRDTHLIPNGISKVESAHWYIRANKISKPENTLITIGKLADKERSIIASYKEKLDNKGYDLWADSDEIEYFGVTTHANYEEGLYPKKVAFYELKEDQLTVAEECPRELKELLKEIVSDFKRV